MNRLYGKNSILFDELKNSITKNTPFLLEDLENGAIHSDSLKCLTLTSYLANGCLMRNWFEYQSGWVLTNTELKFKLKGFKTSMYESIGGRVKDE